MPSYDYYCAENGQTIQVVHRMTESLATWGELCATAGIEPGETPAGAAVERLIAAVGINTPTGDSTLKNQGFTKLVKREEGVYENVTAASGENRYMKRGDDSTLPNLKGKIRD